MHLFLNELSLEGQFATPEDVRAALDRVMRMRACAKRYDRAIRVATALRDRVVTQGLSFHEVIRRTNDVNVRRAVLAWIDRDGPFLEDEPLSGGGEEVVCAGRSVSGSSIAEAACRVVIGTEAALTSFSPSTFDEHPLILELREGNYASRVELENYSSHDVLDTRLRALAPPIRSWGEFDRIIRRDFPELAFGSDAMRLGGHPFNPGVADRIRRLLEMLATMRRSILPDGSYGRDWNDRWQRWFQGGELFSDSSETEQVEFDKELTFAHPNIPGLKLRCPWHGKVNSPKIRVHFSFPITRVEPVYVVYIGPKITKR